MGNSQLTRVIDGKANVAIHAGARPAGKAKLGYSQRLVVEGIAGDGMAYAVLIRYRNRVRRTGQGGHERRIDS